MAVAVGEKITVDKFHISKLNVRAKEKFGETEEDQALILQVRKGKIVQPFKARPEGKGYGVYVGRRRFLAKKQIGVKQFTVGQDVIVEDLDEEEAREQSLIENLSLLRQEMNPITRAKQLQGMLAVSTTGLRGLAIRLGIAASTLSEWISVLDLSPKVLDVLEKNPHLYTDARQMARMKLSSILQNELAEVLEKQGEEAFKAELDRMKEGGKKRGIPKDVYYIVRTAFDKRYPPDKKAYETLEDLAKAKNMKVDEYGKQVLLDHVKKAE